MTPLPQPPYLQKVLAILLGVSFLFVSTALTQSLPSHLQHLGHDQQTHEQDWCSWSCQAGHGIHVIQAFVQHSPTLLTLLDLPRPILPSLELRNHPTSRGPPLLFT